MSIKITTYGPSVTGDRSIMATFPQMTADRMMTIEIVREIARAIAERYVDEHYQEIVALIDQNALANLAVANSAKKVAEEIRGKPTVIREDRLVREVYQCGVLGGYKRIS